jgi:environmental stress-induced protein Ves
VSVERIDVERIAPQPWHNGAGLTREIARAGGAGTAFDWRISIAEIARDAPFSAFPGIDRCIVLLRGPGMRLRAKDDTAIDHLLSTPFAPYAFSGDVGIDASLVAGPCSDLNVMTRRGALTSRVTCERASVELPDADITLLLCGAGAWQVDGAASAPLAAGQALLWRAPRGVLHVRPSPADRPAVLLVVRLCHDPS